MNIRPLAKKIVDLTTVAFDVGVYRNPIGNFSLLPLADGRWLCYMRRFQYYIDGQRNFYWSSPHLLLKEPHKHLFIIFDKDFNFIEKIENTSSTYHHEPDFDSEIPYLEDGRFVKWGDELFLNSATFYQHQQHYVKFGMEIQRLTMNEEGIEASHYWNSCENGFGGRQKNWMAVPDRPFTFITGTSSTGSSSIKIKDNQLQLNGVFDDEDLYRGNTNLLKDEIGYYTITHRLTRDECKRKVYNNYFIRYSEDLIPTKFSIPFKFTEYKIEFVTTMLELNEDDVLIGVTAMDDTPEIHIYNKRELFKKVGVM